MKNVTLPGTDISVSRFVFGTASLFNCGNAAKRNTLLSAAVEAGFTHFDTAPYYGFGAAERDLAPILKAHPAVTVTTKVGIYSPGSEAQPDAAVFLRKAAGRFIKSISRPTIDFTLARATSALEGSLRRLGRDVVDIYTLHEPQIEMLDTDEWRRWLERCIVEGKVRTFGLALTIDKLEPFLDADTGLDRFVQMEDSLAGKEADVLARNGRAMQITYGYVSAALRTGSAISVQDVLAQALRRNRSGAIIVSTTKPSRMPQYARLAEGEVDAQ